MKPIVLFLILFLCITQLDVTGQNNYYIKDSVKHVGQELIDYRKLNYRFCHLERNDSIIKLKPDQISEFGLENGKVYKSIKIEEIDTSFYVFISILEEGVINLYFSETKAGKFYFIEEKNGALVRIKNTEESLLYLKNEVLKHISDKEKGELVFKHLKFDKQSIQKLIRNTNRGKIEFVESSKGGIVVSSCFCKFSPYHLAKDLNINEIENDKIGTFSIGLFYDRKIGVSNFSIRPEVHFLKLKKAYSWQYPNYDFDFLLNTSTVYLPLSIRYTVIMNKNVFFLNAGASFSYHLKKENRYYFSKLLDGNYHIYFNSYSDRLAGSMIGYSGGIGANIPVAPNKYVGIELRYNQRNGFYFSDIDFKKQTNKAKTYSTSMLNLLLTYNLL